MAEAGQAILKRLAALALAIVTGGAAPAAALAGVPPAAVEPLLDDDELEGMDPADRGRLLRVLAHHPSAEVRHLVMSRLIERPPVLDGDHEAALAKLVNDPDPAVHWTAIASVGPMLAQQDGLERLRIVAEWAVSPHRAERLAIACALARVETPVAKTTLELLAGDEDPAVRNAARRTQRMVAGLTSRPPSSSPRC
jgi:hypothetical protein